MSDETVLVPIPLIADAFNQLSDCTCSPAGEAARADLLLAFDLILDAVGGHAPRPYQPGLEGSG